MLFFQVFQQLVDQKAPVKVELKNDMAISGQLQSVDQYLNVKLTNVSVDNPEKYPHLVSLRNCFVRGSVVRYIHLLPQSISLEKLQDDCRREAKSERSSKKAATA
jgi:U6 snRNA-associated Sm-like protein LSm2